ncbi:MAG TPA: hypothetical protein DEQ28_00885, partial [Clostridiales bacterium]|nr:hypothetical protein [Clostridiales bacterium]
MTGYTLGRMDRGTPEPVLALPPSWHHDLNLPAGGRVRVSAGSRSVLATLVDRVSRTEDLRGNRALLDGLRLPEGVRLGLTSCEGGNGRELRLGPVVGILTARGRRSRFGCQTPILREMTRFAGEQGVLAFAFTPSGIDWERGTIRGHVFREWHRGWRSGQFPFPDVVYNRVPSRRAERNPLMATTSARLVRLLGPRYFNPCFLDKWHTYRALAGDPRLRALLPETRRYSGVGDLLDMLDRFREVYLKPTGGSQGLGIIRVVQGGDGQFTLQHQGKKGVRLGVAR